MNWTHYQRNIFEAIENRSQGIERENLIVQAAPGGAKCLGKGTKILMYDGSIKNVEDIIVGDLLMGPDSIYRRVTGTNKGYGDLVKIIPTKGESWICNSDHILILIESGKSELIDLPLNMYYTYPRTERLKLIRTGVEFGEKYVELDPYIIGLWLGDGTKDLKSVQITNSDKEIMNYCEESVKKYNCYAKFTPDKNTWKITIQSEKTKHFKNIFRETFKQCIMNGEKRIPEHYLINSRDNRLYLLAGLLDTDGNYHHGFYTITTKYKGLCEDILFLARSLGLAAYSRIKVAEIKELDFKGKYYSITISGELSDIPCKVYRKIASKRQQIKNVLHTGFSLEFLGQGEYYGFTLAYSDGRFLLGDFTITHNTTTIIEACNYISTKQKVILLSFNKHIADELGRRVPSGVESSTLNALGWRACRNAVRNVKLDTWKDINILRGIVSDRKEFEKIKWIVNRMIGLCKAYVVTEDIIDRMREIAEMQAIEVSKSIWEIFEECYRRSIAEVHIMSFDDQIFQTIYQGWEMEKYDFVMVDESQDLSLMNMELIKKVGGCCVFVGDKYQSCYLFRGAAGNSMEVIRKMFDCKELPLSICFRCPEAVIGEARNIYPEAIESPTKYGMINENGKGIVETVEKDIFRKMVEVGDFVLCRTNAPLIKECLRMLPYKPCYVRGREIREGLLKLIDMVAEKQDMGISEFAIGLTNYSGEMVGRLNSLNKEMEASNLQDQVESLQALMVMVNNVSDLIDLIVKIIPEKEENGRICFMSLHKSKGLETKNIWILRRDLVPHPKAKTGEQVAQENNLLFIGITRSRGTLRYVTKERGEK